MTALNLKSLPALSFPVCWSRLLLQHCKGPENVAEQCLKANQSQRPREERAEG